jgi:hypothetical protein
MQPATLNQSTLLSVVPLLRTDSSDSDSNPPPYSLSNESCTATDRVFATLGLEFVVVRSKLPAAVL